MNKCKIFSIIAIFSIGSVALAAGTHSDNGGHTQTKSSMKMDHWASPKSESARKNPVKLSSESILTGAELYQGNCASCHGEKGLGDGIAGANLKPAPANLRAMAGTHPDGDFAYKIKTGRGAMPGWGNILSNADVWHLVNYIQLMDKGPVASNEENLNHGHLAGEGHGS